jgi:hypothetical protein
MDEAILEGLRAIVQSKKDIELFNVYKGVPVLYKASAQRLHDDVLMVAADAYAYEAVCLGLEKRTLILSDALEGPVSARVTSFEIATGLTRLEDFAFASGKIGERLIVRVAPKDSIDVAIEDSEGNTLAASLIDISMDGLGVHLQTPGVEQGLKQKPNVRVKLELPTAKINLSGAVRYIRAEPDGKHRAGISFSQDILVRTAITNYIAHRRGEILSELQAIHQDAHRAA